MSSPADRIEILTYADCHFDGVSALWGQAFPNDPPRNDPKTAIPLKQAFQPDLFIVAVEKGRVVGSAMAGYDGHRGWLDRVCVLDTHRRHGIGARLICEAEARLKSLGCVKINLQVLASNGAVVGFYERLGYGVEERISMGKPLQS